MNYWRRVPQETDGPLGDVVPKLCPWLFSDLNARVVQAKHWPEHFGSSILVVELDDLRLKFERDRSQYSLAAASRAEREPRLPIEAIIEAAGGTELDPPRQMTLDGAATLFQVHRAMIGKALSADYERTKSTFQAQSAEWSQRVVRLYRRHAEQRMKQDASERPKTAFWNMFR